MYAQPHVIRITGRRYPRWTSPIRTSCLWAIALILGFGTPIAAAPIVVPNADDGGSGSASSSARATVGRLYSEVFTGQHGEICTELMTTDAAIVTPIGRFQGPDGFNAFAATIWAAFPDAVFTMDNVYESDGAITVLWSMTGTHLGPLASQAASGNSISLHGLALFNFAGNRIAASWIEYDQLSLFAQVTAPVELPPHCLECRGLPF